MHTFNLPPPHCLDNSPNNQHNCREKSLFFLSKSSYRSRMSLASSYFSSFFFINYKEAVKVPSVVKLCPRPIRPVKKDGRKFHSRYTLRVSMERKRYWLVSLGFLFPACSSVNLHLMHFWPWHQWVTADFYVSLSNRQHVAPGDLLLNLCMQLLTIDPPADSDAATAAALHTWQFISKQIGAVRVTISSRSLEAALYKTHISIAGRFLPLNENVRKWKCCLGGS